MQIPVYVLWEGRILWANLIAEAPPWGGCHDGMSIVYASKLCKIPSGVMKDIKIKASNLENKWSWFRNKFGELEIFYAVSCVKTVDSKMHTRNFFVSGILAKKEMQVSSHIYEGF